MRSLVRPPYTPADILPTLQGTEGRTFRRFEVRGRPHGTERIGRLVGDGILSTVIDDGPGSIRVNQFADQDVAGSFEFKMWPDERLRLEPYTRLIHVYQGVELTQGRFNGQSLEWPCGVFVWGIPEFELDAHEIWSCTLFDKSWLLEKSGPGLAGYYAEKGASATSQINEILRLNGFSSAERVQELPAELPRTLVYGLTTPRSIQVLDAYVQTYRSKSGDLSKPAANRAEVVARQQYRRYLVLRAKYEVENAPTTWLRIIQDICEAAGFERFRFNWAGFPVARPAQSVDTAKPSLTYRAGDGLLMLPLDGRTDPSRQCNRVFVQARQSSEADTRIADTMSDLNNVLPGHPLTQKKTGIYMDGTITDVIAADGQQLQAKARTFLLTKLRAAQSLTAGIMFDPRLELLDVTAVQVPGSVEFNSPQAAQVRQLNVDLANHGFMSVEWSRLYRTVD